MVVIDEASFRLGEVVADEGGGARLDEFEVQMYSCEIGTVKPEPEIYLECCRRLGCAPAEAVFLDDKKVNTEAGRRVGMHSYVFHSADDGVMQTGEQEVTVYELRLMLLA